MTESVFGENLKFYRKQAGYTQKELGEKIGIGQVVIANYERGARFPGEFTLRKLAEALNISLDYLLSISTIPFSFTKDKSFDIKIFSKLLLEEPVLRSWELLKSLKKVENYSAEQIFSKILSQILMDMGEAWFKGDMSVTDEHIISNKIRELVTLVSMEEKRTPSRKKHKKWIGFCAPGELHDLALFMMSHLMEIHGWQVFYLGTGVPISDIQKLIESEKPHILCISVTMKNNINGLETYLKVLENNIVQGPKIILGGNAINENDLVRFPQVNGLATNLAEGISLANNLLV